MFSLNQAITNWRQNFKQFDQFSCDDIDELESHLRDEISVLKSKNLTDEEAFILANHRLGDPMGIKSEYQKVHPNQIWKNRFFWMLTGFVSIVLLKSLVELTAKVMVLVTSFLTTNLHTLFYAEIIVVGMCIVMIGLETHKFLVNPKSSISRLMLKRLNIVHYILIAFFVSIGQLLPRFLARYMGSIHHTSYWENWSGYGAYLSNLQISMYLFNTFIPLILFFLLLVISRTFNKTTTIN